MSEVEIEVECPDEPRLDYSECESIYSMMMAAQIALEMDEAQIKTWCLREVRLLLRRGAPDVNDVSDT